MQHYGLGGRVVFAFAFFASAVVVKEPAWGLVHLLLTMLLLRLIDASGKVLWRGWILLAWLVVPIIVLHLLFTPGKLLLPSLGWGPSIEGIEAAGRLSLRLALLFFSALLLLRSLSQREWMALAAHMPWPGNRLSLSLKLLPCMQRQLTVLARRYHQAWQLRGRPLWAPGLLLGLLEQVLELGRLNGTALWLRWHDRAEPICWGSVRHTLVGSFAAALWLGLTWLW